MEGFPVAEQALACLVANREVLGALIGTSERAIEDELRLLWPDLSLGEPEAGIRECQSVFVATAEREECLGWRVFNGSLLRYWSSRLGFTEKIIRRLEGATRADASIVVWGAAHRGLLWKAVLASRGLRLAAFVDNDPEKRMASWHGVRVVPLEEMAREGCERVVYLIVAGSFHWPAIREQLMSAGVDPDRFAIFAG